MGVEPLGLLPGDGIRAGEDPAAAGLTLAALGERTGLRPSQLSLLENGRREPRLSTLAAVARALGVEVADLLSTAPPPTRRARRS